MGKLLWARAALASDGIILDTETTGLGPRDQVIEIGIIDMQGNPLLSQRLRPTCPISPGAYHVHGITAGDLADCPTLAEIGDQLRALLAERPTYIYNAEYDQRLLRQSAAAFALAPLSLRTHCVMKAYAAHRNSRRWLPLQGGDHTAVGDCLATLAVIRRMAGVESEVAA